MTSGQAERDGQNHRCGPRIDRQKRRASEGESKEQAGGTGGDDESGHSPGDGKEDALDERLRHDLPARGSHRQPDGGLAAPRDGTTEQQIGDIGAGDEQNQAAHAEKNLQAAPVPLLHHPDARASGHDRDDLLGECLDDRPASSSPGILTRARIHPRRTPVSRGPTRRSSHRRAGAR